MITKQEFKTAFKLITGKNVNKNTVCSCKYNMIIVFFDLFDKEAIIMYFERGLINLVNAKHENMSYEDILSKIKE